MSFFSFFKTETKKIGTAIGIDIGSYAIKIVQLTSTKENIKLDTYGDVELSAYDGLPVGSLSNNLGEDKIVKALKDLFSVSKISNVDNFYISIPVSESYFTFLDLPNLSDKEIKQILPFEMKKTLPIPISEVSLDYFKITNQDKNKKNTYLITAIKNDILDKYTRIANELNLKNFSLELSCFSLMRIVLLNRKKIEENSPVFIVDIGARDTIVMLLYEKSIRFLNLIKKGSFDNTEQIQKIIGVSMDVAEESKRIFGYFGDDSSPYLKEVMNLSSFPLLDEVKHLLFQQERLYNISIDKIYLSGGGSLTKGIKEEFSNFLEKEISFLDSFSEIDLQEKVKEYIKDENQKYALVTGLTLKFFN